MKPCLGHVPFLQYRLCRFRIQSIYYCKYLKILLDSIRPGFWKCICRRLIDNTLVVTATVINRFHYNSNEDPNPKSLFQVSLSRVKEPIFCAESSPLKLMTKIERRMLNLSACEEYAVGHGIAGWEPKDSEKGKEVLLHGARMGSFTYIS